MNRWLTLYVSTRNRRTSFQAVCERSLYFVGGEDRKIFVMQVTEGLDAVMTCDRNFIRTLIPVLPVT